MSIAVTQYRLPVVGSIAMAALFMSAALPLLAQTYGERDALKWWVRWRVFYMACAELWGWRGGNEWIVSHYRFTKP